MSQATEKAQVPVPIVKHLAPPYAGAGPDFNFSIIKSGPAAPNFWSAIRHDVTKGGLVVQLGQNPNTPPNTNHHDLAFAGFQYQFTTPAGGANLYYSFQANFDVGTITKKNDDPFWIVTYYSLLFLDVPKPYPLGGLLQSNTPVSVCSARQLQPNKTYRVQVLCGVEIFNRTPAGPYGEVIIKGSALTLTRSDSETMQALKDKNAASERASIIEPVDSLEAARQNGLTAIF
jgi:hypothetical protein